MKGLKKLFLNVRKAITVWMRKRYPKKWNRETRRRAK